MEAETTTTQTAAESAMDRDLLCPLCGYNLRGLTQPRCPECGFAFTWQELLDAEQNKHPYLFEYGRGRNIKTFWTTFWRTCRPRRFWTEVNPAQDVRMLRLIIYWILSSSTIAAMVLVPYAKPVWVVGWRTYEARAAAVPAPGSPGYYTDGVTRTNWYRYSYTTTFLLDDEYPPPWRAGFWQAVKDDGWPSGFNYFEYEPLKRLIVGFQSIFLAWPLITLTSLLVFRLSLRQAQIKTAHLFRTVIYTCDFGPLAILYAIVTVLAGDAWGDGWKQVAFVLFIASVTAYRLTVAFRKYLRVHLPFATALTSQMISVLMATLLLLPLWDFSRKV